MNVNVYTYVQYSRMPQLRDISDTATGDYYSL